MSDSIKLLSEQVANQIAAGEVVERPASVLKELMENAIDAGATQVDVEVVAGGRKALVVADNGKGMRRDDALLSVQRHATSKIREVGDLDAIGTLGFRGEALAAISSVSRFVLTTRTADEACGTEIMIHGGTIQDVNDAGSPVGTTIRVRNLFYNVPARRKFLKTEQTENFHLRRMFQTYLLAHPEVGFSLTVDGKEQLRVASGESFSDRLLDIHQTDFVKALCPVDHEEAGLKVSGLVSLPSVTRKDRNDQHVFINGRPASAPVIMRAVSEGYQGSLMRDRHPVVFLFIEIDPALVDVNVHPTKKEVRFRNAGTVRDACIRALEKALHRASSTAGVDLDLESSLPEAVPRTKGAPGASVVPKAPVFQYPQMPLVSQEVIDRPAAEGATRDAAPLTPEDPAPASASTASAASSSSPWAWCRILGQTAGRFAILETEDGVVMLDPHAAHERVIYERFIAQMENASVSSQGLLVPQALEFDPATAALLQGHLSTLQELGFAIEIFDGSTFMVNALPACLGDADAESLLREILADVENLGRKKSWDREQVAKIACRAAVRRTRTLADKELEKLVHDLARTRMPYTDPSGKPTLLFFGYNELNRRFGK